MENNNNVFLFNKNENEKNNEFDFLSKEVYKGSIFENENDNMNVVENDSKNNNNAYDNNDMKNLNYYHNNIKNEKVFIGNRDFVFDDHTVHLEADDVNLDFIFLCKENKPKFDLKNELFFRSIFSDVYQ